MFMQPARSVRSSSVVFAGSAIVLLTNEARPKARPLRQFVIISILHRDAGDSHPPFLIMTSAAVSLPKMSSTTAWNDDCT